MSTSYSPKIVTDGLVLYLDAANPKSYPGSGTDWYDLSGNNNNVSLNGTGITWENGYFSFNGSGDYCKTINNLNLSSYNSLTITLNIRLKSYDLSNIYVLYELGPNFNSYSDCFVASANDNSASQNYECFLAVKGNVGYNNDAWSKTYINDLNWKNWCAIFDMTITSGKETKLYTNGQNRLSLGVGGYSNNNTSNFGNRILYILSRGGTSYFTPCYLSSVQIYNKVLSDSEILQNYNSTKGRFGL